ncbi:MAG: TIGR04283 family arsenosugar biosynthesis glycosyltransferase [Planctomycetales bacterium]|nr:TIGR04283 family arsenosugar biosynthesis glycosyltransferase [Planctomycetales bacterium]
MALKFAVVIPACNEEAAIGDAVRSAWEAGASEVAVVDGESEDRTTAYACEAGAVVVACPAQRARQQNLGARATSAPVLLFLHADCRLPRDAQLQLEAACHDQQFLWDAFRQRIEAPGMLYRLLERGNALRAAWGSRPYGDQAIFVTRAAFEAAGGFPEEPFLEDLLLARKLSRLTRAALLPGPVVVDPRRWQRRGVFAQTFTNWALLMAHACGVSPQRLAGFYRRHEKREKFETS